VSLVLAVFRSPCFRSSLADAGASYLLSLTSLPSAAGVFSGPAPNTAVSRLRGVLTASCEG
jgi:hypothetical protein